MADGALPATTGTPLNGAAGGAGETTPADLVNAKLLNQVVGKVTEAANTANADVIDLLDQIAAAITADIIGGTTGTVANRVLVAKGTGGRALQAMPVTVDSSGNVTMAGILQSPADIKMTPGQNFTTQPTGNPSIDTLSSFICQGTTVAANEREFLVNIGFTVSQGSGGSGNNVDKVAVYVGALGVPGGGDIWALNSVTVIPAGYGSRNAFGYELDFNNYNRNYGDTNADLSPAANGLGITGIGSFRNTSALTIQAVSAALGGIDQYWNRGIFVIGDVIRLSTFQDFSNSITSLDIQGAHTYCLDMSNSATSVQVRFRNNCQLVWTASDFTTNKIALFANPSNYLDLGFSFARVISNAQCIWGSNTVTCVNPANVQVIYAGDSTNGLGIHSTGNVGNTVLFFERSDGQTQGTVTTTGAGGCAYNTTSDYRMKENLAPLSDAIERVMQLKPIRFTYKGDPKAARIEGFLAHEAGAVVPGSVVGVKDAIHADGRINPQQMDVAKLVPLLVAAVQELARRKH